MSYRRTHRHVHTPRVHTHAHTHTHPYRTHLHTTHTHTHTTHTHTHSTHSTYGPGERPKLTVGPKPRVNWKSTSASTPNIESRTTKVESVALHKSERVLGGGREA